MATGLGNMKKKALVEMNKEELLELCKGLDIGIEGDFDEDELIAIIKKSGKYVATTEKAGASVKKTKDGKRIHPALGEYVNVIVHPTQHAQQGTSIFASINLYTVEFQPHEEVSIPKDVAKFLKDCSTVEHYFDKSAMSDNGNLGAHKSRGVPKYIVEVVSEII